MTVVSEWSRVISDTSLRIEYCLKSGPPDLHQTVGFEHDFVIVSAWEYTSIGANGSEAATGLDVQVIVLFREHTPIGGLAVHLDLLGANASNFLASVQVLISKYSFSAFLLFKTRAFSGPSLLVRLQIHGHAVLIVNTLTSLRLFLFDQVLFKFIHVVFVHLFLLVE